MWTSHLFHRYNRCHVIGTIVQLYMVVGLWIKLKSMSVRSTSLRLPQNPRIAARVLLKRANMSFVLVYDDSCIWLPAFFSYFFWPVFCWLCCILVPFLHSLWRQGDWMKTSQSNVTLWMYLSFSFSCCFHWNFSLLCENNADETRCILVQCINNYIRWSLSYKSVKRLRKKIRFAKSIRYLKRLDKKVRWRCTTVTHIISQ